MNTPNVPPTPETNDCPDCPPAVGEHARLYIYNGPRNLGLWLCAAHLSRRCWAGQRKGDEPRPVKVRKGLQKSAFTWVPTQTPDVGTVPA